MGPKSLSRSPDFHEGVHSTSEAGGADPPVSDVLLAIDREEACCRQKEFDGVKPLATCGPEMASRITDKDPELKLTMMMLFQPKGTQ